jgi:chorismate-pyruvate lyase
MQSKALFGALVAALCSQATLAQDAQPWPDSFVGRLEVFALMEQLNGELLASRSATTTLEAWCGDHRMAEPARIVAIRNHDAKAPLDADGRSALDVSAVEPVRYRRVQLACGAHVLSEAENWYVPSRLTAAMNRMLETTDTPFGRAVQDLHPSRQTLSADRLWSPLPKHWDMGSGQIEDTHAALTIPRALFRHRAVLFDSRHRPIAMVIETYTGEVLNYRH